MTSKSIWLFSHPPSFSVGGLRLCLLELVLGGLGTPLGTAEYHSRPLQSEYRGQWKNRGDRVGYLSVQVQNEPTSDTSNICGSGPEPLLACHCASVCTLLLWQASQPPLQWRIESASNKFSWCDLNIIGKIERTIEAYIQYLPSVKGLLKRKQTSI